MSLATPPERMIWDAVPSKSDAETVVLTASPLEITWEELPKDEALTTVLPATAEII